MAIDKKKIRSIERPVATEKLIRLATRRKVGMIVQARDIDGMLQLAFFKASELRDGKPDAALRIVISGDDYVTQDLKSEKTKWYTGKLENVLGAEGCYFLYPEYYQRYRYPNHHGRLVLADPESWRAYIAVLGPPADQMHWWRPLMDFQRNREERLLEKRRAKELEAIDAEMAKVPELPDDFAEWCQEEVLYPFRYLMYEPSQRASTRGYCTYCKKRMQIDQKKIHPRRDHRGVCPVCGSEITFKTANSALYTDQREACIIQKTQEGFVCRYFTVWISFDQRLEREDPMIPSYLTGCMEKCRVVYSYHMDTEGVERLKPTVYEWGIYKQRGEERWCNETGRYYASRNTYLYTGNLPEAIKDTPYQYCAIGMLQEKAGHDGIPVSEYLGSYISRPYLEYFVKLGLTNLLSDSLELYTFDVHDPNGKTMTEILGLTKDYIRILQTLNGNRSVYDLLLQCSADGVLPDAGEVLRWYRLLGGDDETIGLVNAHRKDMSLTKFLNWLERQKDASCRKHHIRPATAGEKQVVKNIVRDWKDYLYWSVELGRDLHDLYYLLPPDLQKAHDGALEEYKAREREMVEETARKINEALRGIEGIESDAMHMAAGGLQIVIPKDDADIRREGELQHHCVATYIDKVAKGETMILFVRRAEQPEKPYFTMEYKDGHVAQCRGFRNCTMTKDVELFVKAFEKKMQTEEKKKKARNRIKVRAG